MRDNNFYTVHGWMINNLKLSGNELICYAVIYGFSQDQGSYFMGSLTYLKGWMNVSVPTVLKVLNSLVEKKLIAKREEIVDKVKRCYYQVTKESLEGGTKETLVGGTKETLVHINNNIRINNKSISNDIQKVEEETGLSFNDFYKLYPLKKSKQQAEKSWNRLSKADRQAAIDKLPAYIADCIQEKRSFKHPSTYLNQRTWEDDFTTHSKVSFYDVLPTDSEQEKKFKNWMRTSYPNIENTALPLSYGDFMSLYTDFGTEEIKNQLEAINANIGKYKYSDINAIIRGNLEDI
jgi:DNA-binding MarR family transcriptional regulator